MLFGLSPALKVAVILGNSAAAAAETETPIPSAAVTATHKCIPHVLPHKLPSANF
jgi:hypothetical protein